MKSSRHLHWGCCRCACTANASSTLNNRFHICLGISWQGPCVNAGVIEVSGGTACMQWDDVDGCQTSCTMQQACRTRSPCKVKLRLSCVGILSRRMASGLGRRRRSRQRRRRRGAKAWRTPWSSARTWWTVCRPSPTTRCAAAPRPQPRRHLTAASATASWPTLNKQSQ